MNRAKIEVTAQNLWFVERYLNVFDVAVLFPADAISQGDGRGVPVVFHTDRGFDIVSDIDGGKMQLRDRSKTRGWLRWTSEHNLRDGDLIVIERLSDREYALRLERIER